MDEDKKSAHWKIVLARELRKQTSATNPWIAERLNMGHPSNVSRQINAIPNIKGGRFLPEHRKKKPRIKRINTDEDK